MSTATSSHKGNRQQRKEKKKAEKRARKLRQMESNGMKSVYARKRKYLDREGGFGFEYPEPKPWK